MKLIPIIVILAIVIFCLFFLAGLAKTNSHDEHGPDYVLWNLDSAEYFKMDLTENGSTVISSQTTTSLLDINGNKVWEFDVTEHGIYVTQITYQKGLILIGGWNSTSNLSRPFSIDEIICLNLDRDVLWISKIPDNMLTSHFFPFPDGRLMLLCWDKVEFEIVAIALNDHGEMIWKGNDSRYSSFVGIGNDGKGYCLRYDGIISRFGSDGSFDYSVDLSAMIPVLPCSTREIVADEKGNAYVSAEYMFENDSYMSSIVIVLDSSGNVLRTIGPFQDTVINDMMPVYDDGVVIFADRVEPWPGQEAGNRHINLMRYGMDGSLIWNTSSSLSISVQGLDGSYVIFCDDYVMTAIANDGTQLWSRIIGHPFGLAIGSGVILVQDTGDFYQYRITAYHFSTH